MIWLTFVAGLLVVLLLCWLPGTARLYQAGPLATAHAMLSHDCARCHQETFRPVLRLWPGKREVLSVPDHACSSCHAGPVHYPGQLAATHHCAECHREHRGREILARLPDRDCLSCHGDLEQYRQNLPDTVQAQLAERFHGRSFLAVTGSFPGNHPEFALWRGKDKPKDRANLRFNHARHLQAQGVHLGGIAVPKVLPRGWALAGNETRAHLDCSACHQAGTDGKYLKPINYESHCAICHPLSIQVVGKIEEDRARAAAALFSRTPAPHREPQIVRAVIRQRFLDFVRSNPVVLGPGAEPLQDRLVPRLGGGEISEQEWVWVKGQLGETEQLLFANKQQGTGERLLFTSCVFCHHEQQADNAKVSNGQGSQGSGGLPVFAKTDIPDRWYPYSTFRHNKHRMLACQECHPAGTSERTLDVLIPQQNLCGKCHKSQGGARHDCVECHTYHDRPGGYGPHRDLTISSLVGP